MIFFEPELKLQKLKLIANRPVMNVTKVLSNVIFTRQKTYDCFKLSNTHKNLKINQLPRNCQILSPSSGFEIPIKCIKFPLVESRLPSLHREDMC